MRAHAPLVKQVVALLARAEDALEPLDRAVKLALKQKRFGARDRRFIARSVYEIERNRSRLAHALDLDPQHLSPKDWYQIWQFWWSLEIQDFPDKFERAQERWRSTQLRAICFSLPSWLDQKGQEDRGSRWPCLLWALQQAPQVHVRVNRLWGTLEDLERALSHLGVSTRRMIEAPAGLIIENRASLSKSLLYEEGAFEFQDGSSQQIAPLLELESDMSVLDACAGAGGKTLHVASLLEGTGTVWATDSSRKRLYELQRRRQRARALNVQITPIDQLRGPVDRLLLDVPCSQSGVWRRKPDLKWRTFPEHLNQALQRQEEILRFYSRFLRPGGLMVYATCSVFKFEAERQIERFLVEFPHQWELKQIKRWDPDRVQGDGFAALVLEKKTPKVPLR